MNTTEGTTPALESATPVLIRLAGAAKELIPHRSGAGFVLGPLVVHFERTYCRHVRNAFDLGRDAMAYRLGYDGAREVDAEVDGEVRRAHLRVVR